MDIIKIAEETFKKFPHKIKKPDFKVTKQKEFVNLLLLSPLILHHKKDIKVTPALTARRNDGVVEVHFCPEILFSFSKSKKFIEALTLHELYHIKNNFKIENEIDAIFSEEKVHEELKNDFPKYENLLESF